MIYLLKIKLRKVIKVIAGVIAGVIAEIIYKTTKRAIVEVIYGILNSMDVTIDEFEKVRIEKQEKR